MPQKFDFIKSRAAISDITGDMFCLYCDNFISICDDCGLVFEELDEVYCDEDNGLHICTTCNGKRP